MGAGLCDRIRECCLCCLPASKGSSKDDDHREREPSEEVDEATIQSDGEDSNPSERDDGSEEEDSEHVDRDSGGRRTTVLNYGGNPSELVLRSRGDPKERRPEPLPDDQVDDPGKEREGAYGGRLISDFMGSDSEEEDDENDAVPRKGRSVFGGPMSKTSTMFLASITEVDVSEGDIRALSQSYTPGDESDPLLEALLEDDDRSSRAGERT